MSPVKHRLSFKLLQLLSLFLFSFSSGVVYLWCFSFGGIITHPQKKKKHPPHVHLACLLICRCPWSREYYPLDQQHKSFPHTPLATQDLLIFMGRDWNHPFPNLMNADLQTDTHKQTYKQKNRPKCQHMIHPLGELSVPIS